MSHSRLPVDETVPDLVEGDGRYRSPNLWSVVTVALGGLSLLALIQPVFWLVPLIAIVMGLVSLRSLAAHPEQIGRRAVLIGLALAMFFGAWASTRYFSRQRWLTREARERADLWVELIRTKQLKEAHQWHLRFADRRPPDVSMDDFYSQSARAHTDYWTFFGVEPLQTLAGLPGEPRVEFQRLESYEPSQRFDTVTFRYRILYEKLGREQVLPIRVVMRRQIDYNTGDYEWYVSGVFGV
jgi:hypothetical protein